MGHQAIGLQCDSIDQSQGNVIRKALFWEALAGEKLNDRQQAMLHRLLDGFEGKLTSSKWAILTKTSQDTASRDINDLIDRAILRKDDAGGRSASYSLPQQGGNRRWVKPAACRTFLDAARNDKWCPIGDKDGHSDHWTILVARL